MQAGKPADEARGRELRALERKERARAHQSEAERRAAEDADPEHSKMHKDEAATHARAAELHAKAAKTQARHRRNIPANSDSLLEGAESGRPRLTA